MRWQMASAAAALAETSSVVDDLETEQISVPPHQNQLFRKKLERRLKTVSEERVLFSTGALCAV